MKIFHKGDPIGLIGAMPVLGQLILLGVLVALIIIIESGG